MTKNTLVTLMILFIAAASFWFFSLKKDLNKTQEVLLAQKEQTPRIVIPKAARDVAPATPSPETLARQKVLQDAIQKTQTELTARQQWLAEEAQAITALKARLPQIPAQNYSSNVDANNERIQNLVEDLRSSRQAELDLSRRAELALRVQDSQTRLRVDQLDQDIKTQMSLIQQTRDGIVFWTYNNGYAVEQQAHLDELQALLEAQMQRLQEMHDQRNSVAQDLFLQTENAQGQVQAASAEFADDRSSMNDELNSLRAQIAQTRQQQNQNRMSSVSLSSQINQAQKDYDAEAAQVKTQSESLQKMQEELRLLR